MTLPPILEAALTEFSVEHVLVLGMLLTSLLLVAVFMERCFIVLRARLALRAVRKIVTTARTDGLEAAHTASQSTSALAKPVLLAGLDRATGRVPGDPRMALGRELRRFAGALKARLWLLATAGALMPFVGLFGTVLGVMASFEAIGESGQGGFAVVSVGISQALIATAVGIAVRQAVSIRTIEPVRVRMEVDGEVRHDGRLAAGDSLNGTGAEVILDIGDLSVVTVKVDGTRVEPLHNLTSARRLRFVQTAP